MCEAQWEVIAEISLKKHDFPEEITCICSRVFISIDYPSYYSSDIDTDTPSDDESSEEQSDCNDEEQLTIQENINESPKSLEKYNLPSEQESVSCYSSASTDDHDSFKEIKDTSLISEIQQSDSGTDLTERSCQTIEEDWHKFWSEHGEKLIWESWIDKYSAYINPDYFSNGSKCEEENNSPVFDENTVKTCASLCSDNIEVDFFKTEQNQLADKQFDNKETSKKHLLLRNLSGSDEKISTDVSEGWNPLSPVSVDGENEVERLLSSRCSSSLKTIDSMTNVTRMTVSSINLSNSISSSDSFSSVSSANSSVSSEESEEDHQQQWNLLWKQHYEEEYLEQYNKYLLSVGDLSVESESKPKSLNVTVDSSLEVAPFNVLMESLNMEDASKLEDSDVETDMVRDEMIAMGLPLSFGNASRSRKKLKKNTDISESMDSQRNIKAAFSTLGLRYQENSDMAGLKMRHFTMSKSYKPNMKTTSRPEKTSSHIYFDDSGNVLPARNTEKSSYNTQKKGFFHDRTINRSENLINRDERRISREFKRISRDNMPISRDDRRISREFKCISRDDMPISRSDRRISREFKCISRDDMPISRSDRRISREFKCISRDDRRISREFKCISRDMPISRDDMPISRDDMPISREDMPISRDDMPIDRDDKSISEEPEVEEKAVNTKKRKQYPSEADPNSTKFNVKKYWLRRFSLFSKFDEGIMLDEESWYSVTPEKIAKNAAERCKCDVIIDAFCGAGGNAIQFALTCKRVIAIDIDPKKIEMAKNNAEVYGVRHKIDFICGDFMELAGSLEADVVFLSPPWGGPGYQQKREYDLEKMLLPVPFSELVATARRISMRVSAFLPKNSNVFMLLNEADDSGKVEIQKDYVQDRLIALTVYYNDLVQRK